MAQVSIPSVMELEDERSLFDFSYNSNKLGTSKGCSILEYQTLILRVTQRAKRAAIT